MYAKLLTDADEEGRGQNGVNEPPVPKVPLFGPLFLLAAFCFPVPVNSAFFPHRLADR